MLMTNYQLLLILLLLMLSLMTGVAETGPRDSNTARESRRLANTQTNKRLEIYPLGPPPHEK